MLEVVFIELIRSNLQPIYNRSKSNFVLWLEFMRRYYEENAYIFNLYKVRGWILSGFAPVLLFFPMLLLYSAFENLSVLTPIYLLIFVLLLIPWLVVPALFMFYNPKHKKGIKIAAYSWSGIMIVAIVNWLIFIITW
jgi:hypothetical protein